MFIKKKGPRKINVKVSKSNTRSVLKTLTNWKERTQISGIMYTNSIKKIVPTGYDIRDRKRSNYSTGRPLGHDLDPAACPTQGATGSSKDDAIT